MNEQMDIIGATLSAINDTLDIEPESIAISVSDTVDIFINSYNYSTAFKYVEIELDFLGEKYLIISSSNIQFSQSRFRDKSTVYGVSFKIRKSL